MKTSLTALAAALAALVPSVRAADPPKVVFVAGTKSHGWGAHEFNAGCLLMEAHLKEALGDGIETVVHRDGWPADAGAFGDADAIVLFMDGGGRHPINDRLGQIGEEIARGCGLMCMHYAVEVPVGRSGKALQDWIGGYYESGWSVNPHWTAKSKLNRDHPITRGVEDFEVKDEWYFNMRFRERKAGVTSVLEAVPDDEARSGSTTYPRGPKEHIVEASGRSETLCWAVEREDGGRGVGFTGAHFHANFADDGFRKLVLNAVAWTAGVELPEGGLATHKPGEAELDANQDFPKPGAEQDAAPEPAERRPAAGRSGVGPDKAKFRSPVVNRATPGQAVAIEADITGAKELFLVVEDGGDSFSHDWADWAEPRIVVAGREQRLTDLKWKSARSDWGQVRVGGNAGGGELKIAGRAVEFGIGTHATSFIHYELPDGATRFLARGGLDNGGTDQAGGRPSVRFAVYTERPRLPKPSGGGGGGFEPEESLEVLAVGDGLQAELFAHEPMLLSPASIDIDHRGRIWVAEIVNYRRHNGKRPEGDRILILEDTDGDGAADSEKVFYQGRDIDSPHGVCVLGERVIVSAGEQVLVFTDADGDDRPEKKEVLFNVVGGNQHDHGIHAFCFGPDGKLYFNFGNASRGLKTAGGETVVDLAGNRVEANRQPYQQGMVFRCDLDGSNVETLGWNFRNNWEVTVDSFGTMWQSDNDDDGNRGVRINYVMDFGNYGYVDELTGKGWRDKRTNMEEEVPQQHWHLNDPGVVPTMLLTGAGSPTGIVVYEGDLLPAALRGQVIHTDAGPNVCRAYPREADGAGYTAEMLPLLDGAGADRWFRPSDVAVAPDGSLLVADWYDPGVGGHGMGDLEKGRLFRLTPEGHRGYRAPKHDLSTAAGAAMALRSPNSATRYLAWQALHGMGEGGEAGRELAKLCADSDPIIRARGIWLLGKMGDQGAARALELAGRDADPDVRCIAVRLARQLGGDRALAMAAALADDADPAVRRECALALRGHTGEVAAKLWADLAEQHDGGDRWYLEALGIGAAGNWDACLAAWRKAGGDIATPAGRDIVWRSRAQATPALLAEIVTAETTPDEEKPRYMRAFDFLSGPEKDAALLSILAQ